MGSSLLGLLTACWVRPPPGFYTPRERAALAWTEALTRITAGHAPDDVYEEVRREVSDEELIALSIAIGAINLWNRMDIGFRNKRRISRSASAMNACRLRKQKEEEERQERERRRKAEQARVDRLLGEAAALRQAKER